MGVHSRTDIEKSLEFQKFVESTKEKNTNRFLQGSTFSKTKIENLLFSQKKDLDVFFLRAVISVYLKFLSELTHFNSLKKIALRISNTTDIDVWIELKDDDEEARHEVLLGTANNNSEIQSLGLGYYFILTLVEEMDELDIPTDFDKIDLVELRAKN